MKFQVKIQFSASSLDDFDDLILLEDSLIRNLDKSHDVDGHDFGQGEFNIFIQTDSPENLLSKLLELRINDSAEKIVLRELSSDSLRILWSKT